MNQPEHLLERLNAIGHSLAQSGKGLGLFGLGSAGMETTRLDEYSDLDFFAIARPGCKPALLHDLSWMSAAHPVAFSFRNTPDGYKVMYEDGVFCEMAVFEPHELPGIAFAEGRFVWKAEDCDDSLRIPQTRPGPPEHSVEWSAGELLTNLYAGMCRYRRGEKLSAFRLVQVHAVDRMRDLLAHTREPQAVSIDPFAPERRIEQQFPDMTADFAQFMQGYERTPESALALLHWVEQHLDVSPVLQRLIKELCLSPHTNPELHPQR